MKLNALDKESIGIVEKMDQLFRVDRVARERVLTLEARHVLRNEESKPILERIKLSIEAARIGGLPQSARTKACEYTLKLWNRQILPGVTILRSPAFDCGIPRDQSIWPESRLWTFTGRCAGHQCVDVTYKTSHCWKLEQITFK